MKHSPAPWKYCGEDRNQCKCGQVWCKIQDFQVATAHQTTEDGYISEGQMMANTRLIAAAPELFDLIVKIEKEFTLIPVYTNSQVDCLKQIKPLLEKIEKQ